MLRGKLGQAVKDAVALTVVYAIVAAVIAGNWMAAISQVGPLGLVIIALLYALLPKLGLKLGGRASALARAAETALILVVAWLIEPVIANPIIAVPLATIALKVLVPKLA